MQTEKQKAILQRLYNAAKNTLFSKDNLPENLLVLLDVNLEAGLLGEAGIDISSIAARLQEVESSGQPTTQLRHIIKIKPAPESAGTVDSIICLADTLIHELIHVITFGKDTAEHGPAFQKEASRHGLEIVYDSSGQYLATKAKPEALLLVLEKGGFTKCG